MKKRLLAAVLSAALIGSAAIHTSADYNEYDYNEYEYGYDTNTYDDYGTEGYTYDDGTYTDYGENTYTDVTEDDSSSAPDPTINHPATVRLDSTPIEDLKFSAQLKVDSNTLITSADITVTYDSKVVKLLKSSINEEAGGEAAAAETEPGVFQYQYVNYAGSDWKDGYFTLDFEIIDVTERSTVLYLSVNSMVDNTNTEITTIADGTIVQIEGAVPVDVSSDESRFSEMRIALSDAPVAFETLGLKNVKSVSMENPTIAAAENGAIKTLSEGLTNMTVEFSDGTFAYYRLVITKPKPVEETPAEEAAAEILDEDPNAVQVSDEITKTETKSNVKVKYLLIYFAVLIAVSALFVEFFMICGNPYAQTAAILRERRAMKYNYDDEFDDDEEYDEYDESENTGDDEEYYDEDQEYDEAEYEDETADYEETEDYGEDETDED